MTASLRDGDFKGDIALILAKLRSEAQSPLPGLDRVKLPPSLP